MSGWLVAAMIAAQSFAIGTTVEGFVQGCRERTYFVKRPGLVAGAKTGGVATVTFMLPVLHRKGHTRSANAIAWAVIGSGVVSGTLDLRTLGKCTR